MALKAGYKGIKKFIADKLNALGDVDSLATDAEVTAQIQAQEQLLDDTVGWLSNNKYDGGNVTLNKSASSSSVTHELDGGFVAGKRYKLRFNISAISGFELVTTLRVQIYKTGSTATKILPIYQITQTVGIQVIEFIAESTQTDCTIQLYIQSSETGESATVTFTDISITHISVDEQKTDNSVIAAIEDGTTASQAYSVGRGFMHNGQFRVAKSGGIASGATISDSNSDVKTIEECLIRVETFSGTTDENSNLALANAESGRHIIKCEIGPYVAIPFATSTGNQKIHACTAVDLSAIPNTNVSGRYYYIIDNI